MILYYFYCCYWLLRKMVTVAKGNFKFPFIFLLFCYETDETEKKKKIPVRALCLLLINQFLYPLNLVGNSATTGLSF